MRGFLNTKAHYLQSQNCETKNKRYPARLQR